MIINWILGGAIVAFTLFIVLRGIRKTARGESGCAGCSGCSAASCPSAGAAGGKKPEGRGTEHIVPDSRRF